jgi:hypothetical protein
MTRDVLVACLPWIALLMAALLVARFLLRFSGARLNLKRLGSIHDCQQGSVQSLSFVLTLPLFVMVMMFIVQVSQITIGTILVHYSAFASARSAIVWVPANVGNETENRISSFYPIGVQQENGITSTKYRLNQTGYKYDKIQQAAVLACLPLAPSRSLGYTLQGTDFETGAALVRVYQGLDSQSTANSRISDRLINKLAYTRSNTNVQVEFMHDYGYDRLNNEPPLQIYYDIPPYRDEFYMNEMGWRDHITVTVTHQMALLPGPGRLLAKPVSSSDSISQQIGRDRGGSVYVWPITAAATLGNEGEKSLKPYWQQAR